MSDIKQTKLGLTDTTPVGNVEEFRFEAIKGYPMLTWRGKRPFTSTRYYPAQLKEIHGEELEGWRNKIYWGDNLQVMSHMLKNYRGLITLVYIDPPFDSKAIYTKKVSLKGKAVNNDQSALEEKQYQDIWNNDEYLQFMYDRLVLLRELLSPKGSIYLHCDWHRVHHLRCLMDEIFGPQFFQNQITWQRTDPHNNVTKKYGNTSDIILFYTNGQDYIFNVDEIRVPLSPAALVEYSLIEIDNGKIVSYEEGVKGRRLKLNDATVPTINLSRQFEWRGAKPSTGRSWPEDLKDMEEGLKSGKYYLRDKNKGAARCKVSYLDENKGQVIQDIWTDTGTMKGGSSYPTEKPEELLTRIIMASSKPGDLVFDCFMGSGTTQSVAMQLGRRFIGSDINLGAVQITTKRLLDVEKSLKKKNKQGKLFSEQNSKAIKDFYTSFEVYNINHYDVFRNPVEAKELLLEALEVNKMEKGQLFDGEKDGRMVKIMPVNRIVSRADLGELIAGLDLKAFAKRQKANPKDPVERITLVCMGHEPDLKAHLIKEADPYKLDVEVVDILRDRQDLQFKRDSEAKVTSAKGKLVIERFYPMNLLGKLSLQKEKVKDWKELVESVMIDWNYDGAVLTPTTVDIPEKDELVSGAYPIPKDAGTICVKITDLLSESLEVEVANG